MLILKIHSNCGKHSYIWASTLSMIIIPCHQLLRHSLRTNPLPPPPSMSQRAPDRFHTTAKQEKKQFLYIYFRKHITFKRRRQSKLWTQCFTWLGGRSPVILTHLSNLVLGGLHTLELLLFSRCLVLLNLFLILLFKEMTFGSIFQVSDLFKLDPVLKDQKDRYIK